MLVGEVLGVVVGETVSVVVCEAVTVVVGEVVRVLVKEMVGVDVGDVVGVVVGETQAGYSELGNVVDLHRTGDQAWIGVGSLWGIGTHAQGGSVYVGSLTP